MFRTGVKSFNFVKLAPTEKISSFNCGDADLNDFILNQSVPFAKSLLAVNYVCVNPRNACEVYAYCSLANDKVAITDFADKTEFNRFRKHQGFPQAKRLKSYPAVKLCRLGVDIKFRGCRIGSRLLDYIKILFALNNKTGCRFLTVDAYLDAIPFYEKNGFVFLNEADKDSAHTRLMYFDLMDVV